MSGEEREEGMEDLLGMGQLEEELEEELEEKLEERVPASKVRMTIEHLNEEGEVVDKQTTEEYDGLIVGQINETEEGFEVPVGGAGSLNFVRLLILKREINQTLESKIAEAAGEVPDNPLAELFDI